MKSKTCMMLAGTLFILIGSAKISSQQNNNVDSVNVLKRRIEELEIKAKLQQEKIKQLEGMVGQLNQKKPFLTIPSVPNYPKPKNGKPFEFNGETYYMLPLGGKYKTDVLLIGKYISDLETLEKTKSNSK
jgi:hypothetical protein